MSAPDPLARILADDAAARVGLLPHTDATWERIRADWEPTANAARAHFAALLADSRYAVAEACLEGLIQTPYGWRYRPNDGADAVLRVLGERLWT